LASFERIQDVKAALEIVRSEIRRLSWWTRDVFHLGASLEALRARHLAQPENDAVRYDLALLLSRDGRAQDALSMIDTRESSTARPYALALKIELLVSLNRSDAFDAMRRFLADWPFRYAYTAEVLTMAEAERDADAVKVLLDEVKRRPPDQPDFRTIRQLIPLLKDPRSHLSKLMDVVRRASPEDRGLALRAEGASAVVRGALRSTHKDRSELVTLAIAELTRQMHDAAAHCDESCVRSVGENLCRDSASIRPADRPLLKDVLPAKCE
jgi:hypothetical protein